MNAAAETPSASPTSAASPGSLIRAAREQAGLSIEDLAGQIKLSKSTLDALERDDFNQLRESLYVRGYYRKCAKVLPVAESALIAAYEARVQPQALLPPRRIHLAGGVASGPTRRQRRQGVYVAVAFGMLLGLLFWMASDDTQPRTPQSLPPPVPEPAVEAVVPVAPAAEPVVATEPAPAPTDLVLNFTEASWVRVEDARSKTLVIGLVRAGERKSLQGETPYTVFLGNARKVTIEFAGRPFDFSRHVQQNDTARFSIP